MITSDIATSPEPSVPPRRATASGVPGVIIAGADQRITATNATMLTWLGYTVDELRGRTIKDICAEGPEWTAAAWARYQQDGAWEGDVVLRTADGQSLTRHVKATVVGTDTSETYVSVLSDPAEDDAVERARAAGGDIFASALPAELHRAVARAVADLEALAADGASGDGPSRPSARPSAAVERLRDDLMRIAEIHRRIETQQLFTLRDLDERSDGEPRPATVRRTTKLDVLAVPSPDGLLDALDLDGGHHVYSKPAMVVLSHAIEDGLLRAQPGGLLLGTFQRLSFMLPELDRYRALASRVAAVHIWGIPDAELPADLPANLHVHPVDPGDSLIRSWLVIALASDFWSALLAEDMSGVDEDDPLRPYRGGWTSDRRAIEQSIAWIAARAGTPPPVVVPPLPAADDAARARHDARTHEITNRLFRHLDRAVLARQAALEGQGALAADNARLFRREETLRREAERLAELQKLLSHSAVHDLRNTMSLSLGSLELLRLGEAGSLNEVQRELVEAAAEGSERTIDLAQSILDVARLEAGAFPLRRSSVDGAALGAVVDALARPRCALGQAIAVTIERHLPVASVDLVLLDRMLANVLDNARKYAPRAPVEVAIRAIDGALEIAIRDHGPGVPEAARVAIFAPFRQASDDQARRGTGLGLAFCRLASGAHGGSIRLESPPDGGARFVICLPRDAAG